MVLVPDTNFIKRNYYSNYLKDIVLANSSAITMMIPRLVILEIENIYNRNHKISLKQVKGGVSSINDKILRAEGNVRTAFQSMSEIVSIRKDGGLIIPRIDLSLMSAFVRSTPEKDEDYISFSEASGRGFADAWIRQEFSEFLKHVSDSFDPDSIFFLTCDLMNALTANAEDLNIFYFYRRDDFSFDTKKVPSLLYNTAIHFNYCQIKLSQKGRNQDYRLIGMWNGKMPEDWNDKKLQHEEVAIPVQ